MSTLLTESPYEQSQQSSSISNRKPGAGLNSPARRLRQLQRVLTLIFVISRLRYGATLEELGRDMAEEYGRLHERTVRRDLQALEEMAMVYKERTENGVRWLWNKQHKTEQLEAVSSNWVSRNTVRLDSFSRLTLSRESRD